MDSLVCGKSLYFLLFTKPTWYNVEIACLVSALIVSTNCSSVVLLEDISKLLRIFLTKFFNENCKN